MLFRNTSIALGIFSCIFPGFLLAQGKISGPASGVDFAATARSLADARIVVIGGDPAFAEDVAFRAGLTRQLCEAHGFSVLLMDAGFFDGELARNAWAKGNADGRQTLVSSLPYGLAAELQPLADLMTASPGKAQTVQPGGYQANGMQDAPGLAVVVRQTLQKQGKDAATEDAKLLGHALLQAKMTGTFPAADTASLNAAVLRLLKPLYQLEKRNPTSEAAGLARSLENFRAYACALAGGHPEAAEAIAARNLCWHLTERYPGEKIVVWADNVDALKPGTDHRLVAPFLSWQRQLPADQQKQVKTILIGDGGTAASGDLVEIPLREGVRVVVPLHAACDGVFLRSSRKAITPLQAQAGEQAVEKTTNVEGTISTEKKRIPIAECCFENGKNCKIVLYNNIFNINIFQKDGELPMRITHPKYKIYEFNVLESIIYYPSMDVRLSPADSTVLAPGSEEKILESVWVKLHENHQGKGGLFQRGVLRLGTLTDTNSLGISLLRHLNLYVADPGWNQRMTGLQLLGRYYSYTEEEWAATVTGLDSLLQITLNADVVASAFGPVRMYQRSAFTFGEAVKYQNSPEKASIRLPYTCPHPDLISTGLNQVTSWEGELWVDAATFAVIRHTCQIRFADGRTEVRKAVYYAPDPTLVEEIAPRHHAPVWLQVSRMQPDGTRTFSEWHGLETLAPPTTPFFGGFARALAPADPLNPDFWNSFWSEWIPKN